MDKSLKDIFAATLQRWADAHPEPDAPAISLGNGFLSPRQIAAAVKNDTPEGQFMCELVEHGAKATGEPIEKVIARFEPGR